MAVGPTERMVETSQVVGRVRTSEDMQEGIRANKEKPQPAFRRR